jgi:hypothetical protein
MVVLASWLAAPAWVLATGRILQAAAITAFALHAWPRVKPWMEEPG